MSTKTTFKRIALVAVVALGLGAISTVSANAATGDVLRYYAGDTAAVTPYNTGTAVAGPANTVTLQVQSTANKRTFVTIEGLAGASILSGGTVTVGGQSTLIAAASETLVVISTPIAGTLTAKAYLENGTAQGGIFGTTASDTVTITVGVAALSGVYNAGRSSAYLVGGDTSTATSVTDAAGVFADGAIANTTPRAYIVVTDKDATGTAVASAVLTASVSGPAFVTGSTAYSASKQTSYRAQDDATTGETGLAYFAIHATGQSGVATITVKTAAGTVVTTKTVTFGGSVVATHTVTANRSVIKTSQSATATSDNKTANTYGSSTGTYDVKILLKDSNGYPVRTATVTATAADTSIITSVACDSAPSSTGYVYCNYNTGAVAGTTVVTFSTGSSSAGTKVTSTTSVTVGSATPASVTLTADASVAAGGVVTYTLTAKNAAGQAVPDGTSVCDWVYGASCDGGYSVVNGGALADLTNNANTAGALFTGVKFKGGVATDTVLAPYGDTTLVAAIVMEGTAGVKDSILPANLAGATLTASTKVTNASTEAANAATDAANEATDAANAATDAALAAADAADAATAAAQDASDAVAALSATVAKLVASLKAQITSLTNLVIKIQKKVRA